MVPTRLRLSTGLVGTGPVACIGAPVRIGPGCDELQRLASRQGRIFDGGLEALWSQRS